MEVKKLADDHWDFLQSLLATHGVKINIDIYAFYFKQGFIHGFKHGKEQQAAPKNESVIF